MKIFYEDEWIEVNKTDPRVKEVGIEVGQSVFILSGVKIGSNVKISSKVWIGYDVIIGSGVQIGACVEIGDFAVIGADAVIEAGAVIDVGSVIEANKIVKVKVVEAYDMYTITLCNGLFWIGCEGHSVEHWEKHKDEIAKANKVNIKDRKYYDGQFEKLKGLMKEYM